MSATSTLTTPICVLIIAALSAGCAAQLPIEPSTLALTAIAPSPPTAPLSPTQEPAITESVAGFTFSHPASWSGWQPNAFIRINEGPLLYVSNFPLLPACATRPPASPNPPDSLGYACQSPFTEIPPGGVFIQVFSDRLLRPMPTAGEEIELLGRPAWLEVSQTGGQNEFRVDEAMSAAIADPGTPNATNTHVMAWLRGPGLEASEAAVRALFASLR